MSSCQIKNCTSELFQEASESTPLILIHFNDILTPTLKRWRKIKTKKHVWTHTKKKKKNKTNILSHQNENRCCVYLSYLLFLPLSMERTLVLISIKLDRCTSAVRDLLPNLVTFCFILWLNFLTSGDFFLVRPQLSALSLQKHFVLWFFTLKCR